MEDQIIRMKYLIDNFYKLNRSPVSQGSNKLVKYICDELKILPSSVKAGQECLTWIIPKFWNVTKGILKDSKGNIIIDQKNNPLHLWAHSVSCNKEITKEELEKHLFYSIENPKWIPYHYRNQFNYNSNDWGFCLSYENYLRLNDSTYFVDIETTSDTENTMDYVNYYIQGESDKTYLFAAHTCHPALVTDGLSCISVLIELIKEIEKKGKPKNSYRFIFGAEYYAAAAFLHQAKEQEIKNIAGGFFIDMLGNNKHVGWQTSFQKNSYIDKALENIMNNHVANSFKRPYRKLWGNDEMFYNGPGFLIPTAGIGGDKFQEYHFDADNNKFVNYDDLVSAIKMLVKLVEIIELDAVPTLKYKGPLYQSRYDIYIDPKINPTGYDNLESIQILADGKTSILDISTQLNVDFFFIANFVNILTKKGLAEISPIL